MKDDLLSSLLSAMPELRTDTEILVADVSIQESLAIMCQQGLVILNCVGPVSMSGSETKETHVVKFGFEPTTLILWFVLC